MTVRPRKVLTMSQVLYSSAVHLLPKDLRFEHRDAKRFFSRAPSKLVTLLAVIQYSSALFMHMKWGVAQLHSYSRSWFFELIEHVQCIFLHTGKLFANVYICSFLRAALCFNQQGRNEGGRVGAIPRAPNHSGALKYCDGRRIIAGAPKSPNNVTSTFFNTVHLLPNDIRFEHGGAKLASCPGHHLSLLRPYQSGD